MEHAAGVGGGGADRGNLESHLRRSSVSLQKGGGRSSEALGGENNFYMSFPLQAREEDWVYGIEAGALDGGQPRAGVTGS